MKTIKELEAELRRHFNKCSEDCIFCNKLSVELEVLKDVLGLIDIRLKQNDRALSAHSISQAQYNWTKKEFEKLKARITG